jgi:hypothetical protein
VIPDGFSKVKAIDEPFSNHTPATISSQKTHFTGKTQNSSFRQRLGPVRKRSGETLDNLQQNELALLNLLAHPSVLRHIPGVFWVSLIVFS